MATALKPIGHEDRLTIVDHLDELRTRLIVCAVTLAVAFGACFWQNGALIDALNKPLADSTQQSQNESSGGRLSQVSAAQKEVQEGFEASASLFRLLATSADLTPEQLREAERAIRRVERAADALPRTIPERKPVTLGPGEPFTVTLAIAAYFALLFSLPVLLYQAYAFVLPAFSPKERRVALPLMLLIPLLFIGGAAFGYFLVLPPAISFLQNFNDQSFDVLIRAKEYYRFEMLALLSTGLVFQLPVGLLALNAAGIVTARMLRSSWRYAVVAIAVVAAILPGVDPVTTVILMVPLLALYLLSILLLTIADRRRGSRGELAVGETTEGT